MPTVGSIEHPDVTEDDPTAIHMDAKHQSASAEIADAGAEAGRSTSRYCT